MAASSVADVAVGFEWTPFSHGFVFWEYPGPEHLPPPDEAGRREWLEGFLQARADYPDEPYDPDNPDGGETWRMRCGERWPAKATWTRYWRCWIGCWPNGGRPGMAAAVAARPI